MNVFALVVAQLEYDGYLRICEMQARPERPLTIALADEFDEPHSGPFHFLDGRYEETFENGFAECKALKLSDAHFAVVNGEYHFKTSWRGIPTQRNSLSCYCLSLPEFAVPIEIRFNDPHSNREYLKNVIRDNRRNRFVAYLECRSSCGSFDFLLEVRFKNDRENFRSAKYTDNRAARGSTRQNPVEDLAPREFRRIVRRFLTPTDESPHFSFAGEQAQLELIPSVTFISANRAEVVGDPGSQNSGQPKENKPNACRKLPPKGTDYSQWFDGAKLTDKQQEVMSLRVEYGLSHSEIARRLGISRKTVYEHYNAAERKLQYARSAQKRAQNNSQRPD